MPRLNLYAQNRHTVIVDGLPMSGFAEGEFLTITREGGGASRTKGGDGPALNIATKQGGSFELKLLPTSQFLGELYAGQRAQQENPRLFSILVMDGTEAIIKGRGCAYGDPGQFTTGGEKMGDRAFLFEALEIEMDETAIEALAGGFI